MRFKPFGRGTAEMPFLDHLEELRWRILWSLLALLVGVIIGIVLVFRLDVIDFLMRPVVGHLPDEKLIFLEPAGAFFVSLKLGLAIGMILAAPVVIYQIWAFLSPALTDRERKAIIPSFYLGLVLFVAGAAMAYYAALPVTITFLLGINTEHFQANLTAPAYFSFVTKMLLGFGVIFEMPVVAMVLAAMGLVTSAFLRSKRRYAVAGMAVLAAMITPGDVIAVTVILMVPLLLLYELSILLARLMERGRARALRALSEDRTESTDEQEQGHEEGQERGQEQGHEQEDQGDGQEDGDGRGDESERPDGS